MVFAMKEYALVYFVYTNFYVRLFRILFFVMQLWIIGSNLTNGLYAKNSSFSLLSVFLMLEVFFRFKISRMLPKLSVANNTGNIEESVTIQARALLHGHRTTKSIVLALLKEKKVQFVLEKANSNKKEVTLLPIAKEELLQRASIVAKQQNGQFITMIDLFTAYMLLTEEQTKLLFTKGLKQEEFLHIAYWARVRFSQEETIKPIRVHFWGEGIGEDWVSGWTIETKKYMVDITSEVLKEKPLLVGRETEYKAAVEGLSKKEKNSIILIGEPGSGKTALYHALAFESFVGNLGGNLYHQRFFELMVGALLAGATDQGVLESRLQAIMQELSHAGNIVVVIPGIQDIMGASTFKVNLSGALLPYMKNGTIRVIGTTTSGEYKQFVEPSHAFTDVFTSIFLTEPTKETAVQMLLEKAVDIEEKNNVFLTYKAIVVAIEQAIRYINDRVLPGSAVTLLIAAAVSATLQKKQVVTEDDVTQKLEEKTHIAVAKPKKEEKELLLHLEEKLHDRVIGQEEAVHVIAEAMRRIRSGLASPNKPISFLFLGPTGVGKTEVSKALASLYFGSEKTMIRLDMSEYKSDDAIKRMLGASPGEGDEKGELTEKIHDHPFSLVLLDEFEKAQPAILDLFLAVLEDGRLTDNKGKTVSFNNAMIIATSNAASEFIRQEIGKETAFAKDFHKKLLEYLQVHNIFKPELLNRFDAVVTFMPLTQEEIKQVVKLLLQKVVQKLLEQDITLRFDEKVIEKVANEGFDKQFGARPIRRFIQDNIEDVLAQKLLREEIKRGDVLTISTGAANEIILT